MRLFTCPRHAGELRITAAFCGALWQRAQTYTDPEDRVRTAPCVGCPTGARHAGRAPEPQAVVPRTKRFAVAPRVRTDIPVEVDRVRRSRKAREGRAR